MSAPDNKSSAASQHAASSAVSGHADSRAALENAASPAGDRDARLAQVLAELSDRLAAGETPRLDDAIDRHPDLAAELTEVWTAVVVAQCVARAAVCQTLPAAVEHDAEKLRSNAADGAASDSGNRSPAQGADRNERHGHARERFGAYELLDEIGRGGMGVIYRAVQHPLGRHVAVKMVLRGELASAVDVARFRAEASAAGQLDHPNIVPIYDVGEHDGRPYFSMRLVDGTTLGERFAAGPMPPREAAALLAKVARAIDYAHRQGVLHRDLKPSNILIDGRGEPHVTDFGLARRVDSTSDLTRSGAILGTPAYMAPEQAAGSRGQLGPATDVYGLGAILYHALAGRPPFQAATPLDTVLMVLDHDPLPPHLLVARADRTLEMVALKCLQKPAELRYASACKLADDLDAYLAGEPVSARAGGFGQILSGLMHETHHAIVLENMGFLWMLHAAVILALCLLTNWIQLQGVTGRLPYLALWTLGLGTWAAIFWQLRRRAGPVTFVERQLAHVWGASIAASTLLFGIEAALDLPVLTLSPVLPILGGVSFVVKAGMLSGRFYAQAGLMFATALAMARWPTYGLTMFGVTSAICFFVPGVKYYRQRARKGTSH